MAQAYNQALFVAYGNACINNASKKTPDIQKAFKADFKKNLKIAGYPTEMDVKNGHLDKIDNFDMSNTLACVPEIVAGFVQNEQRGFDLPAVNNKTAAASIKPFHFDKKKHTGQTNFGGETKTYTSVTGDHEGYKIKNRTSPFKKK